MFYPPLKKSTASVHHYRKQRGSADHTVRPGLNLHVSEAVLKDLNPDPTPWLVLTLKQYLQSSTPTCVKVWQAVPPQLTTAPGLGRVWRIGRKATAWWANTEPNKVWTCHQVLTKQLPLLHELGRASPEESPRLCVMGIYAGGFRGLKWHINPCDSQIICDHSYFMEVFKW